MLGTNQEEGLEEPGKSMVNERLRQVDCKYNNTKVERVGCFKY